MKHSIKLLIIIILIIFTIGVLYLGWIFYDTVKMHKIEIPLSNLTSDEKEKLISLNFLELESYPSSIEFIELKEESEIRETQFYIKFSIDKEDEKLYKIEKNVNQSTNEITIKKISESNGKFIYDMNINFAQNSKDKKWDFLLELINRYKT